MLNPKNKDEDSNKVLEKKDIEEFLKDIHLEKFHVGEVFEKPTRDNSFDIADTCKENPVCRGYLASNGDQFVYSGTFVPFTVPFNKIGTCVENTLSSTKIKTREKLFNIICDPKHAQIDLLSSLSYEYGIFQENYLNSTYETKHSSLLSDIDDVGFLFHERTRIRPLGNTVNPSAFTTITVQPGEVATYKVRTFSKTSTSIEESSEQENETKNTFSSTDSTEFTNELQNSLSKTTDWNIATKTEAQYNTKVYGDYSGEISGDYGVSATASSSGKHSAKEKREITKKIETRQKNTHKITVNTSREDSIEDEAIRILKNEDFVAKDFSFHKVFQKLLVTLERTDVQLCWAPCVKDPARDVRQYYIEKFGEPELIHNLREKWKLPTTSDSPSNDVEWAYQDIVKEKRLAPGTHALSYTIPTGYELDEATIFGTTTNLTPTATEEELITLRGFSYKSSKLVFSIKAKVSNNKINARVKIKQEIIPEGTETLYDHARATQSDIDGLHAYNKKVNILLKFKIKKQFGTSNTNTTTNWDESLVNRELYEIIFKKIVDSNNTSEFKSELIRRVIIPNFEIPQNVGCSPIRFLERIFDFKNIGYKLFEPFWNETTTPEQLEKFDLNFFTASWAKVYFPIQKGSEELAILLLLASELIPSCQQLLPEYESYISGMKQNLEPMFSKVFVPTEEQSNAMAKKLKEYNGICPTEITDSEWKNDFEKEDNFKLIDAHTVEIPTDGVHGHENTLCNEITITAQTRKNTQQAKLDHVKAIIDQIKTGNATINVNADSP